MKRAFFAMLAWALALHATPQLSAGADASPLPAERWIQPTDTTFARLVARLSEPGGYFDSDNLISNEASYLHVLGALRRLGVNGGAYIGVGPEQNFSYIAQIKPHVAYLVDIRRDNLLQHLWYKALFALSRNRAEFMSLMLGRPMPPRAVSAQGNIDGLIAWFDSVPPNTARASQAMRAARRTILGFGVPLSQEDLETISRYHQEFIDAGLELRFTSLNRPPRFYYPTLRQLILEKDLDGRQLNFLAHEADFQTVKQLQEKNLIIPVTGDLAGEHALVAIGRDIASRGEHVSAFYVSNVEFYLMRQGSFDEFAKHAAELPRDSHSAIIRSLFGGMYRVDHPQTVPGYFSTQLAQTLDSFAQEYAEGGYRTYQDVVTKHILDSH
jgi:hypothetical protein